MAVELKSRLEKALAGELPSTLTFNYPTVEAIVTFVLSEVLSPLPPVAAESVDGARQSAGEVAREDVDAGELAQALRRKLEAIKLGG
jgi:myxalamid-type polyketide synthase MxaB